MRPGNLKTLIPDANNASRLQILKKTFLAKLGLLEALVEAKLTWLAVTALVFALIGAYYYLRVVMLMYFEEPKEGTTDTIQIQTSSLVAISVNGGAALLLGLFPSYFIDLCRLAG